MNKEVGEGNKLAIILVKKAKPKPAKAILKPIYLKLLITNQALNETRATTRETNILIAAKITSILKNQSGLLTITDTIFFKIRYNLLVFKDYGFVISIKKNIKKLIIE